MGPRGKGLDNVLPTSLKNTKCLFFSKPPPLVSSRRRNGKGPWKSTWREEDSKATSRKVYRQRPGHYSCLCPSPHQSCQDRLDVVISHSTATAVRFWVALACVVPRQPASARCSSLPQSKATHQPGWYTTPRGSGNQAPDLGLVRLANHPHCHPHGSLHFHAGPTQK